MTKRILISGYYGFGNIGDEAVLRGILNTFRQVGLDARVTVLSADPASTLSDHPVDDAVHRYRVLSVVRAMRQADLVISGGGSLLQDVTSGRSAHYYLFILRLAHLLSRKTMVYAQGIGPLKRESTRRVTARVLNKVSAITVRDEDSAKLLKEIGVDRPPIHLSADPAFLVEPDPEAADDILRGCGLHGQQIIGVSLRPWPRARDWLSAATQGIRQAAAETGARIMVLPMQAAEDQDVWQCAEDEIAVSACRDVPTVKGLVSKCELLVGMRLHSLIFAAGEGVPFVPIVYDPKVSSFAAMAGQSAGVDIASIDPQTLAQVIRAAWQDRAELRKKLLKNAGTFRKLALKSGKIAKELLE